MFITNDYLTGIVAKQREVELIENARIAKLLAEIKPDNSGFRERSLSLSGEILMRIGRRLKDRYELGTETRLSLYP